MSCGILIALLLFPVSCSVAGPVGESRAKMDHGIDLGAKVAPTALWCRDGSGRRVGESGKLQIVTFATPYDCSACTPHLDGVPKVVGGTGLAVYAFTVMWAPNRKVLERQIAQVAPDLPICVNEDGSLWEQHNLLHTPFTAVLNDGVVVYLNDSNLQTEEERHQFAADLKSIFPTTR